MFHLKTLKCIVVLPIRVKKLGQLIFENYMHLKFSKTKHFCTFGNNNNGVHC